MQSAEQAAERVQSAEQVAEGCRARAERGAEEVAEDASEASADEGADEGAEAGCRGRGVQTCIIRCDLASRIPGLQAAGPPSSTVQMEAASQGPCERPGRLNGLVWGRAAEQAPRQAHLASE